MNKEVNKLLLELLNLSIKVSETTGYNIHFEYSGAIRYINIYYFEEEKIVEILKLYMMAEKERNPINELLMAKDKLLEFLLGDDEIEEIIK